MRLRALRESPHAFGSRYEDQVGWPLTRWRERTAALAAGDAQIMFVAEADDGRLVGCAGAYVGATGVPVVISMWTAPEHRRQGVAGTLLGAVAAWARRRGARRLTLWVVRGNDPATRLYAAFGFRPTHVSARNEHGRIEDQMALDLQPELPEGQ
jgi:GNAT superfamily N-acetyltransferase